MARRSLLKLAFIYAAGNGMQRVAVFLATPVLAQSLPIESIGTYALVQTISQLAIPLLTWNMSVALTRESSTHPEAAARLLRFIATIAVVSVGAALCGALFLKVPAWAICALVLGAIEALYASATAALQGRECAKVILTVSAIKTALFVVLVALVVIRQLSVTTLLQGQLVTSGVALTLAMGWTFHELRGLRERDAPTIRLMIGYSVATLPHTLALWLSVSSDRFLIDALLGRAELGAYALAYTGAQAVTLGMSGITAAVPPRVIADPVAWREPAQVKRLVVFVTAAALGIVFCASAAVRLEHEVLGYIKQMPPNGPLLVALLGAAFYMAFYYVFFAAYLYLNRKTGPIAVAGVLIGPLNLLAMCIFIDRLGIIGAACGVIGVYTTFAVAYGRSAVSLEPTLRKAIPFIVVVTISALALSVCAGLLFSWTV